MESLFTGSFLLISLLQSVFGLKPKEVCLLQVDEGSCRAYVPRFTTIQSPRSVKNLYMVAVQETPTTSSLFKNVVKRATLYQKFHEFVVFQRKRGGAEPFTDASFFNMTSMQCDQFFYGGCDGNENNFQTPQSCMEYCIPSKSIPVICQDVLDHGKCSASIPRYYYNSATKTCEEFIYTGCGGSNNNFVSKQSCMDVCGRRSKKWKPRRRIASGKLQHLMHIAVAHP